ncbi:response regulator [Sabulilitoribacter multivorans]|uniref:histidine kinase n=1 Tax=Flaviramulus multivorans TaxID=1304750 RepID=A0ABS9IMA4_9FLAO|nr:hybrid sensor histidine kinase/response regulator transcription factor [Flaviramulus multivorans]MCF7561725.1 response regulator [Flaviramulus multivorans]
MKIIDYISAYSKTFIGFFILISSQLVWCQSQIAFSHLSIEDGLSQNSIISMAQDSIGYMWFATQDGLNRYDGNSFKIYNKQFEDITRPNFSRLGKIYIDKQNKFWAITNSGNLEFYNPKDDAFYKLKTFNSVSTIIQDNKLNTYIGTYGKGFYKIDAKTKDTIQLFKNQDINKSIYDFFHHNNHIYIAASGGLFVLKENDYHLISNSDPNLTYSSIERTSDGTLWFGTFGSGLYFKKQTDKNIKPFKEFGNIKLPENLNIEDLLIDSNDNLWIATYGKGAFILDFEKNKTINFLENKSDPFAIHYNDILSLYEDNTGIVWLGSDGAGVSYYDRHLIKFNVLTNKQMPKSVNIDVVRSVTTNEVGEIWIGTSGKGLTYVDIEKNIYKTFKSDNSCLNSNRIISLSYSDKSLWIGHQGFGLNIMEPDEKCITFPEISNHVIWKIVPISPEKSWLCTENKGLILFDKYQGIVEEYNSSNSALVTNNIMTIAFDSLNNIYIGTQDNGVFLLEGKTKEISKINLLSHGIKSLIIKDEVLWVGTNGHGLERYDLKAKNVKNYTKEQGLPNNVIYGILPDDDGNLWLSSNIGLTKFKIINEKETPIIENYNNYDGLQALEFNTGAYYKSDDGTLYFGGLEGINWFHPSQFTYNTVEPKTIITGLELFNKPIEKIENHQFNHNENTITFTFSSLHFSQPERNQFKYRLINNDPDWINSGKSNRAHYTNLTPNTYEFQVISSNYDGVWNEIPATYSFIIKQPWYLTNTAITLYVLLFIILVYSVYLYFKWRWQIKLQLQLEHNETERLKHLDEIKTKLYSNVSHEFKTPLSLILNPIESQLSKKDISKKDKTELSLVHRNAKRLLDLVNQLMDLSKLEAGSLKLQVNQDDLSPFIKQLVSSFKYGIKKKNISLKSSIPDIKNVWFDKDAIEKILTNLLSNAVKFTPKNGHINLNITTQKNHIIITIINNYHALDSKNINNLFTRYYRANSNIEGTGIGLALVKELVSLSKGNIVANTINTNEIQFTVTLPVYKEAFKAEDINETLEMKESVTEDQHFENNIPDEKPMILIVEDDNDVRTYITSLLNSTYKVITAKNGKTGINKALKNIPDLIVSDVMMPLKNGIELCNILKQNELTSHIPIILLTAKSDDESELEGLRAKADDYITKPFKSRILETRIANLITLRKALQSRYSQEIIHKPKDIAITSLDEVFLNKIENILIKNLVNETFDAKSFSKNMLMSRMQLHRKLKALTGLSTTEFLRSQRLKLAVSLLKKSDHTISEIAYQVGFSSPSYFIKCFKENYACTPNAYRNNT